MPTRRHRRSGRGAYRGIFSVLLDDPDYQKLSPYARLVLLTARQCQDAGPSAIFRYYPEKLAHQTGLTTETVLVALAELQEAGWIVEDGVLLWVRNGLRYDPHVRPNNGNHREGIEEHLKSLPKRALVIQFCEYYGFDIPFTWDADAMSMGSHIPCNIREEGVGSREEGGGNREFRPADAGATHVNGMSLAKPKTAEVWTAYCEAYQARYGVEPTRNATVNGQLSYFIKRVPLGEAPAIAQFYVQSNLALYVRRRHPIGLLLQDAEGLRTGWLTGRHMTETQARERDRLQGARDTYQQVIDHFEREERAP